MGYRSTFVTNDIGVALPGWFMEKWGDRIHTARNQSSEHCLPISSRYEGKTYGMWATLEEDLSRVLREEPDYYCIHIVWLGEDGAVSKHTIFKDRVVTNHANDEEYP